VQAVVPENYVVAGRAASPSSLIEAADPWPEGWPDILHDLNTAAVEAGVEIPPRQANHLVLDVHAVWNGELFELILQSRQG